MTPTTHTLVLVVSTIKWKIIRWSGHGPEPILPTMYDGTSRFHWGYSGRQKQGGVKEEGH